MQNIETYQVDQEYALLVMEEIFQRLDNEPGSCLHEGMVLQYYDIDPQYVNTLRHRVAIVEIDTELSPDDTPSYHVSAIRKCLGKGSFRRSTDIQIYQGSVNDSDKSIDLDAYLYGTSVDCDVSYPTFEYDKTLKMWLAKGDFWQAPNGIDGNGIIMILDFSEYLFPELYTSNE